MSHFADLDNDIIAVGRPFTEKPSLHDTVLFFGALRKLAAPGEPAPDKDLVEHGQKVVGGDEATPADAEALYQQGTPDTAGHLEGEFAVPVEQVVAAMAQLVSHELKLQLAYLFYAEMLRGLNRDLSTVFEEIAGQEIEDAQYLLRRISVLSPGGVPIPVPPSPTPLTDPQQILEQMITGEQQAIVLLKGLRAQMGENPMKFTVEEMLSEEQEHLDTLWQYMPVDVPEQPAAPAAAGQKIAVSMEWIKKMVASGGKKHVDYVRNAARSGSLPKDVSASNRITNRLGEQSNKALRAERLLAQAGREGAADKRQVLREALDDVVKSSADRVAVPSPGAEPVEGYLAREQQLQVQQDRAENLDLKIRLQQMQDVAAQHQQAADQANMAAQQSAQQAEQATQQAAVAQEQAVSSSEAATAAHEQAAQQAEAKMRLSMRVQQIRQQLADLASQDPVAEEGLNMGGEAGPGGPMTPIQQQEQQMAQQEQEQAAQMAQEQEQAAATGGSKAKKEVQQAQKAQQNAQVQTQQAQAASQGA